MSRNEIGLQTKLQLQLLQQSPLSGCYPVGARRPRLDVVEGVPQHLRLLDEGRVLRPAQSRTLPIALKLLKKFHSTSASLMDRGSGLNIEKCFC